MEQKLKEILQKGDNKVISLQEIKHLRQNNEESYLRLRALPHMPINDLIEQAMMLLEEDVPIEDFWLAPNLYKAKYGNKWELLIKQTINMSAYCCITNLVEWIIELCKKMFEGTSHENNWFFYHDALSQLTAKDTVEWMKQKGYYNRWIHPVNQLHQDQPDLKIYFHHPVGNRPELMPWDNNLNQDVHSAVNRHVS